LILNPSGGGGGAGEEYGFNSGWLNASLTIGASCSINVGHVPGLSSIAPSDNGPWPHNGGKIPTVSASAQITTMSLLAQDAVALDGCLSLLP
jgi:hypothetical protein